MIRLKQPFPIIVSDLSVGCFVLMLASGHGSSSAHRFDAIYVDPSVTGQDREDLAAVMQTLPGDARINVVYYADDGRVLKNRPELPGNYADITDNDDGTFTDSDGEVHAWPSDSAEYEYVNSDDQNTSGSTSGTSGTSGSGGTTGSNTGTNGASDGGLTGTSATSAGTTATTTGSSSTGSGSSTGTTSSTTGTSSSTGGSSSSASSTGSSGTTSSSSMTGTTTGGSGGTCDFSGSEANDDLGGSGFLVPVNEGPFRRDAFTSGYHYLYFHVFLPGWPNISDPNQITGARGDARYIFTGDGPTAPPATPACSEVGLTIIGHRSSLSTESHLLSILALIQIKR